MLLQTCFMQMLFLEVEFHSWSKIPRVVRLQLHLMTSYLLDDSATKDGTSLSGSWRFIRAGGLTIRPSWGCHISGFFFFLFLSFLKRMQNHFTSRVVGCVVLLSTTHLYWLHRTLPCFLLSSYGTCVCGVWCWFWPSCSLHLMLPVLWSNFSA